MMHSKKENILGMTPINFNFSKPFFRTSELLVIFSLSSATLKRYKSEWLGLGNKLVDLGRFQLDGYKEECWNPVVFLQWLLHHKLNNAVTYDYEVAEQNKLADNIMKLQERQTNAK